MSHPFRVREIAAQAGLSQATVDRVLHGRTILAPTLWLAVPVFGRALRGGRHRLPALLTFAGFGVAAGALRRVAGWAYDLAAGDVIEGEHDTILDIVMDTADAAVAALAAPRFPLPDRAPGVAGARPPR